MACTEINNFKYCYVTLIQHQPFVCTQVNGSLVSYNISILIGFDIKSCLYIYIKYIGYTIE